MEMDGSTRRHRRTLATVTLVCSFLGLIAAPASVSGGAADKDGHWVLLSPQ